MYTLFVGDDKKQVYKTWHGLRRRLVKEARLMPEGGKDYASIRFEAGYRRWIFVCIWKHADGKEWGWHADEAIPQKGNSPIGVGMRDFSESKHAA